MGIHTYGSNSVDWEARLDMPRLREDRLARLSAELEASDLGSLLVFDFANIRYMTGTHIGTWAVDKLIRFALLPRGGKPVVWDFGSAARHHQLYNPWLTGVQVMPDGQTVPYEGARAGISTLRGAIPPGADRAGTVADKVFEVLAQFGLQDEPIGVDVIEMPVFSAFSARGMTLVDGQQVCLAARKIKTKDEIGLLTHAVAMVDAAYEELYEFLRPGVRENECVGLVNKVLYDLGSEHVEGVNAISGERCSPHPHVYSDRMIRPGDPAFFDILHSLQRVPDLLLPHLRGGQRVGRPARRLHQVPRAHRHGDRHGEARRDDGRHRRALAQGRGVRLRQRGGGLRPAVRARGRPVDLGAADLQPHDLPGAP